MPQQGAPSRDSSDTLDTSFLHLSVMDSLEAKILEFEEAVANTRRMEAESQQQLTFQERREFEVAFMDFLIEVQKSPQSRGDFSYFISRWKICPGAPSDSVLYRHWAMARVHLGADSNLVPVPFAIVFSELLAKLHAKRHGITFVADATTSTVWLVYSRPS